MTHCFIKAEFELFYYDEIETTRGLIIHIHIQVPGRWSNVFKSGKMTLSPIYTVKNDFRLPKDVLCYD